MPYISSFDIAAIFDHWISRQSTEIRCAISATPREAGLDLTIRHGNLRLSGWLSDHELTIAAERHGDCWNFLLSLDVQPEVVDAGVQCRSCAAGARVWSTIDELIIDHLLDPFSQWVEERFLTSVGLAFFGGFGATWAKLIADTGQAEGAVAVIRA